MDHKVRETAEKIFIGQMSLEPMCDESIEVLTRVVEDSIQAAKVFHGICGKDVVRVGK